MWVISSDIVSDNYSDILSGMRSGTLSGMSSRVQGWPTEAEELGSPRLHFSALFWCQIII